ncbi:MAG: Fe-S cluster assembly protein SufD [Thermomicrobiaceae bacterium]
MEASVQEATKGFSRRAAEELSLRRGEPDWIRELRLAAWDTYEDIPMPKRTDEEWRRTDIRRIPIDDVVPFTELQNKVSTRDELPAGVLSSIPSDTDDSGLNVQVDSSTVYSAVQDSVSQQGVIFTDLATAIEQHPELVKKYFQKAVPADSNKFAALNSAFWSGGTFLYVPSGVKVEVPFRNIVRNQTPGASIFARTLIAAEEEASVVLVDQWSSADGEDLSLACNVIEVHAEEDAQVRYIQLQDWGRNMWSFATQTALCGQDAQVNSLNVALGGKFSRSNITGMLNGAGSLIEMLGIYFADENQHIDHLTRQEHVSPYATSDLLIKGALKDRSRTVYSGLIKVHPHAQRTDAYQSNRNLVLSRNARADTIPNLEIGANDVRCTHGATVSQVEEEYIFYLMSRGINRIEAQKLIVDGFFDEVIERVPVEEVQEFVREAIARKIGL